MRTPLPDFPFRKPLVGYNPTMSEYDLSSVTSWLSECQRPMLLSHRRPDGDALGSLTAMSIALRHLGLEPCAVLFDELPRRYSLFSDSERWLQWEQSRDVLCEECDAVLIVDTCALTQLEPVSGFLANAPRTLVIDHHATHDPIGTRDGDLRIFDETASATALMIAEWIRSANIPLDKKLATALFVGIATDCGWFRYSNTDARTMRTASELVEAGADTSALYGQIHEQEPAAKLKLIARLLENMELHADGQLAVMCLRPADFKATGADDSMTEDLVNEASRLRGVEATLMITEEDEQTIRVNFRSKSRLDVSELARRFGGGGHARAAGARLNGAWDYVVPRLIAETIDAL